MKKWVYFFCLWCLSSIVVRHTHYSVVYEKATLESIKARQFLKLEDNFNQFFFSSSERNYCYSFNCHFKFIIENMFLSYFEKDIEKPKNGMLNIGMKVGGFSNSKIEEYNNTLHKLKILLCESQ